MGLDIGKEQRFIKTKNYQLDIVRVGNWLLAVISDGHDAASIQLLSERLVELFQKPRYVEILKEYEETHNVQKVIDATRLDVLVAVYSVPCPNLDVKKGTCREFGVPREKLCNIVTHANCIYYTPCEKVAVFSVPQLVEGKQPDEKDPVRREILSLCDGNHSTDDIAKIVGKPKIRIIRILAEFQGGRRIDTKIVI
jgi:hypothetical protein